MVEGQEEENMEGSFLLICKAWGYQGATRETFYRNIRGLNYDTLKKTLASLEEKGLVTLEWIDYDRFYAYITPDGEMHLDQWLADLKLPPQVVK